MKNNNLIFILITTFLFIIAGCKKDPEKPEILNTSGKLNIEFKHIVGTDSLILNSNCYINEAQNHYQIDELMYFISDVKLFIHQSTPKLIDDWKSIHFVDVKMPGSLEWKIYDSIPQGNIDSISFIFGLTEQRNQSFLFVNPPESNMFWPDILGGGYHYMMLNGKWIITNQEETPFNFHLGIGQIYTDTITHNTSTITEYVQNYFTVTLPTPNLTIHANRTSTLTLQMDISSWFKTPYVWDFNYWGGSVMQNQRAMNGIKENGFDVFSIKE